MVGFKDDRWVEVSSGGVNLSEATVHMPNLKPYQCVHSILEDRLKPGRGVIVATTHLFFAGAPIRGHQVIIILRHLAGLRKSYPNYPIVLSGDFNMFPVDASRKLILQTAEIQTEAFWEEVQRPEVRGSQTVHPNPAFDWKEAKAQFQPGGSLSAMAATDLFEECDFASTNFTPSFDAILDYVFMIPAINGQSLKLVGYKQLPARADLKPIPNADEASDHLALFGYLAFSH
jgi:mRNA deadenylase 3'-5' endonuclease subunit Ccr4